ncbi:uncharacterized protein PHALS_05101 [Plasmopara halstedii]|uniref:Uncharacterized protein n=1 Tax=Plasmopara halstedii TaxID=4781 RepID=A0A0P1B1C7_PLAHL|nr:uncharacterized protein PHALS_05101 [Plasmopara halstedii]CEG47765.1 hypothetical protein PHALS_05101 [Plasmopara halstedii]|eukprot:XP_024584134.1 hypothetical protein PHALS_05101 [Plasmopara halstedii]
MLKRRIPPFTLSVSSIIVEETSIKDWEYGAINQLEQVFLRGTEHERSFTAITQEKMRAPHRGEMLDPGISTVKERSRQKSS